MLGKYYIISGFFYFAPHCWLECGIGKSARKHLNTGLTSNAENVPMCQIATPTARTAGSPLRLNSPKLTPFFQKLSNSHLKLSTLASISKQNGAALVPSYHFSQL
jgi:hypothetical protein